MGFLERLGEFMGLLVTVKQDRQLVTSCWFGEQFLDLRELPVSLPGLGDFLGSGPECLEGLCLLVGMSLYVLLLFRREEH